MNKSISANGTTNYHKDQYMLIIWDWPVYGCKKIISFDTYKATSKFINKIIAENENIEDKILLIKGSNFSINITPESL
jgi:hypothetical protein